MKYQLMCSFVIIVVLVMYWYTPFFGFRSIPKEQFIENEYFGICQDDPVPYAGNKCNNSNTISFGTVTPKCSSNFVDNAVVQVFGLKSCNVVNRKRARRELNNAIYCFHRQNRAGFERDFKNLFPKTCNYVGSHVDYGITEVPMPKGVKCVRRYTMLRHPVKRLKSAIKYSGGKSLDFIHKDLLYAGDNHMTRVVAGQSLLCRSLPKIENKTDILRIAKYNLQHRYNWFGIVEMMEESMELLGYQGKSSKIIQPALASSKGASFTDEQILTRRRHFELDLELYDFAVELLKCRYKRHKHQKEALLRTQTRERRSIFQWFL